MTSCQTPSSLTACQDGCWQGQGHLLHSLHLVTLRDRCIAQIILRQGVDAAPGDVLDARQDKPYLQSARRTQCSSHRDRQQRDMGQRTYLQLLSSRALSNCCPAAARWPELMEPMPVDSAEKESPTDACLVRPGCARALSFLLLGLTAPSQWAFSPACYQMCSA